MQSKVECGDNLRSSKTALAGSQVRKDVAKSLSHCDGGVDVCVARFVRCEMKDGGLKR